MKLAFVTSLIPLANPDTGFEIANAAIIAAMRAAGHDVSIFGFVRKGATHPVDPDAHVLAEITIENAVASPGVLARWVLRALRSGLPLAVAKLVAPCTGLAEMVKRHGPFDAIVLNAVMMPAACPALLDIAPCVLVEHNVEYLSAGENAAHARNPAVAWAYAREARLLRAIEHDVASRARFTWFLAEEDRSNFGLDLKGRSGVLPLVAGMPEATSVPQSTAKQPKSAAQGYDVGLIGTWTWGPNRTGLDWFMAEVAPRLPAEITVGVAGRLPEGYASPRPSVLLLGRVSDAAAFLASCRTLALASRAGTGVQLKTIEAFQLGKPAVATPVSLRGFAEYPANMRVADDGRAFAAALTSLVADVRAGRVKDVDGTAFMERQREAMLASIGIGLAAITA